MNDLFSERYGYVKRELQYETLNVRVRNFLWDEVYTYFLLPAKQMYLQETDEDYYVQISEQEYARIFFLSINRNFLSRSYFEIPKELYSIIDTLRSIMLYNNIWYECFDLIEAVIRLSNNLYKNDDYRNKITAQFSNNLNKVFEEEKCAYRIVSNLIIPNINNVEVVTIATALTETISIGSVNKHLLQAIKHYSNRENPDYRNAIKEATSALEGLIQLITGAEKESMGKALDKLKHNNTLGLHTSLQLSLTKLYGWSSDVARHAINADSVVDSDDAKLALVTSCSFVNYLLVKAVKAGIVLEHS